MFDNEETHRMRENAAVLALVEAAGETWEWHRIAQTIADVGSARRLIDGKWTGFESDDAMQLHSLAEGAADVVARYEALLTEQAEKGAQCISVLDPGYPTNLRAIYNLPPFLFVRGELRPADDRAIAVVGTRGASSAGLEQADRLATGLAEQGVTVLSGMARGIDTAAHRAALAAGGRTAAVMGTGINLRYPPENRSLADEIEHQGALISQFWPDGPPAPWSFPMRNVVMSGMALGTVVIEASATSGAKMQARLALEHGKLVFLVRTLVLTEAWARQYVESRGAIVIDDVDDVLERLVRISRADTGQLRLA